MAIRWRKMFKFGVLNWMSHGNHQNMYEFTGLLFRIVGLGDNLINFQRYLQLTFQINFPSFFFIFFIFFHVWMQFWPGNGRYILNEMTPFNWTTVKVPLCWKSFFFCIFIILELRMKKIAPRAEVIWKGASTNDNCSNFIQIIFSFCTDIHETIWCMKNVAVTTFTATLLNKCPIPVIEKNRISVRRNHYKLNKKKIVENPHRQCWHSFNVRLQCNQFRFQQFQKHNFVSGYLCVSKIAQRRKQKTENIQDTVCVVVVVIRQIAN